MFAHNSTKIFTIPSVNNNPNINIKSIPRRSKEELIRDLKPILFISRIFGLAPYSISNMNLTFSKIRVAHSGLFVIFISYVLYERSNLYYYYSHLDYKLRLLSILRSVLTVLCVCIDTVLSVLWYRKLQKFLNHIWCYDRTIKSNIKKNNSFVIRSWILIVFCMILIHFIGGLTYLCEVDHLKSAIIYTVIYQHFTIGILKFLILAAIIHIRFQNFNRSLMKGSFKSTFRIYL